MDSNRKVLMLLTNSFDPDPRVYQEARALTKASYDVTVLCWDRDMKAPTFERVDDIKVIRIYVNSTHGRGTTQLLYLVLFWFKALFKILLTDYDVIHSHDFDTLPLAYVVGKLKFIPVIYDSHESYADMLAANVNRHLKTLITKMESALVKCIDHVITVGPALKSLFEQKGARRISVVGNWKDRSTYLLPEVISQEVRHGLGIPKNDIVISYIGHLHARRKIRELLDSISGRQGCSMIIGGYGELSDLVQTYSEKYSNIKFIGYVNPKDIPLYTSASDVVYSAFDIHHPMARYIAPNKLFEALAAGKAVLTGNFGEIADIVKEERCGIVLDTYEAEAFDSTLDMLIRNRKALQNFCLNAKQASQKYNWSIAERSLLTAYSNLSARA